jgi:hypothetical protein
MKHFGLVACVTGLALIAAIAWPAASNDKRLQGSWREKAKDGWIRVHLEGTPEEIGYQHGYLLASEIAEMQRVVSFELTSDSKKDYDFFRTAAETVLWPRIEPEYRAELQGIAEGVRAQGGKLDVYDIVVINAMMELTPYYTNWYNAKQHITDAPKPPTPEHCSAFVATGAYTKDGRIVIGHNNWTGYIDGSRWNIVFDIVPKHGYRILMDGLPGLIHSGDDFGVNSAGLAITETTISRFNGFDPNGVAEFVRARKAMQYAASIDEFTRIMRDGNNGGYANNWLVADTRTNEVASLELGLKNVALRRTKNGYFVGANFPVNEKLTREETNFDVTNMSESPNARRVRATELVEGAKGKIDVAFAKRYLSDHYDSYAKQEDPNERTLCGHIDLSPRGVPAWQPPYGAAGTVQAKAADWSLATSMAFEASFGHPCGRGFNAADYLAAHPEFAGMKELLRDLDSYSWTRVSVAR